MAFAAACSGSFQNLPVQHLPRALDAEVYLETERPLDKQSGAIQLRVLKGILIHTGTSQVPEYSHVMVVRTNDSKQHALYLNVPGDVNFPVLQGSRIELHYKARWDTKTKKARRAVVLRDGLGDTKLIFQEQYLLEDSLLPHGLQVTPGKRIAYTESGPFQRFCNARIEHRSIRLTQGEKTQSIMPGERVIFRVKNTNYLVVAVDNATTTRHQCAAFSANRFAWFLVKIEPAGSGN